jgi:O-antigen/teichoic acid export membrane protein
VSNSRELSRNISWNYLQAGTSLVVYFLLTPIVVGHLGEVGYGIWVLLKAILFYLRFLDLGFHNALVKYVAESGERRDWRTVNGLIATTTSVLLAAGVAALVLSVAIAYLVVPHAFSVPPERIPELRLATVLIGVDLLFAFPCSVLGAVFEGRQRFDVLSGVSLAVSILAALATVAGLEAGYGILALVTIEIGATLLVALLFALFMRRLCPEIRLSLGRIGGPHLSRISGYSTWTSLNEILAEGGAEVEKLLIPMILSVSLLTPYSLICAVSAVIFLAITPLTDTFFPLSSAYDARDDRARLRQLLLRGTKVVMAISLPLAVAVTAYGESFLLAWIGEEHITVPHTVLPLIVASFSVTAFILTATTILLALAKVQEVFWMGVAELALAVLLVVSTVPRLGLPGLAGSLMIANILVTFLWIVPYVCRLLGQSTTEFLTQGLVRPLLAALPMTTFILWLDPHVPGTSLPWLAIKGGAAGCVYLLAFYGLSLTGEERALCRGSVRSMLRKEPA